MLILWTVLVYLTCQYHSPLKTFLETTKLTSVALSFVYFTVAVSNTGVHALVLNSSLKETFAAFAGDNAIMETSRLVLADHADHRLVVFLNHSICGLVVISVKVRFTGLCVCWKLFNVPFPQFRHVNGTPVPSHSLLRQWLESGEIGRNVGEPWEHGPVV